MRNQIVDIARGLASVLVIASHACVFWRWQGWLADGTHIASPLFFFLSGVFLAVPQSWRPWLAGKADALLKPYLVVLLVMGAVYGMANRLDVWQYLGGLLYATGKTIVLLPLWFLPHLFLALCCSAWWLSVCRRLRWPRTALWMAVLLLLACAPVMINAGWPAQGLPFSADLLPLSLALVLAGHSSAAMVRQFAVNAYCFCFAVSAAIAAVHYGEAAIDMNLRIYRASFFVPVLVLAGIYVVLCVAAWLARSGRLAVALAWFGRHSLLVLLCHFLWLRWLFRVFPPVPDVAQAWSVLLVVIACTGLCAMTIWCVQRSGFLSLLLLPVGRNREPA